MGIRVRSKGRPKRHPGRERGVLPGAEPNAAAAGRILAAAGMNEESLGVLGVDSPGGNAIRPCRYKACATTCQSDSNDWFNRIGQDVDG